MAAARRVGLYLLRQFFYGLGIFIKLTGSPFRVVALHFIVSSGRSPGTFGNLMNGFPDVHVPLSPRSIIMRLADGQRDKAFGIDVAKNFCKDLESKTRNSMSVRFFITSPPV